MDPRLEMPGAWDAIRNVPPSLSPISLNKTLYVAKLSDEFSTTPEAVPGLESVEDVMEHFKPEVGVTLDDEQGAPNYENFQFRQMSDFSREGLVDQSKLMRDLNHKIHDLQKINMQLLSNKLLQNALLNPDAKQAMLEMIQQMLDEIDQAG